MLKNQIRLKNFINFTSNFLAQKNSSANKTNPKGIKKTAGPGKNIKITPKNKQIKPKITEKILFIMENSTV